MATRISKIFVGCSVNGWKTFRFQGIPSQQDTPWFGAVIGPFKTVRGANFMAKHGKGNPHLQTVRDAEEMAKRAECL